MQAEVLLSSVMAPTVYSLYINDISQTPRAHLALLGDDSYIYATDIKEGHVLGKLQEGGVSPQQYHGVCDGT